ncbi:aldose 1-epimerase [Paenibacillus sp. IHBB 10380]|uniref:aldose 1-epimerase n=1 Tax=Paenibacillus sp. IHBB 10380 TaxID=1566358 RepID=UPI0005CFEE3A|nr:aldose 1-epimerase [Paenibacillus sp. IHBB 10380]AJS58421.1 aldose epimerase [Paenibacillus sp. IHBB 10380]
MDNPNAAFETNFQGETAIWLTHGRYEAAVLPEMGANLILFRDKEKGYHFLREPKAEEMDDFKASPGIYGIPVLFPPNRYEDGKFPWDGQVYQLPVNEPVTGNHLHGYMHTLPWTVERYTSDVLESVVILSQRVSEGHLYKQYFPFDFTIRLRYTLSDAGLQQQVTVINEGTQRMPNLIAFHTAIHAPFAPDSKASDYRVKITIGERVELNERNLPTGQFQPLSPDEVLMKGDGVNPYFAGMDNHYTAMPQNGRNHMELTDTRTGDKLIYDVGTSYKYWMIWNNGANGRYFCPEPQMNLVNAPNISGKDAEEIGLIGIEPGEIWEQTSRLYGINN